MKAEIIQVLASFVGSFGFAVLYNLRGKKLCMAGISGMVSWIAYLIVWNEMPSTFVANLAAAAVATIYAETMARILKEPAARNTANSIDSQTLKIPDIMSPPIISRSALTNATPGTNSMILPMMIFP